MKRNMITVLLVGVLTIIGINAFAQDVKTKPDVNTKEETPVKIIEYLPGTWVIQSVYRGKENVTTTDTLAAIETIEFNREGRYMSYSGTEKLDSGAYRLNEQHGILYMASENNDDKPVEWAVSFTKDGTMTISMKNGSKQLENINYVYRRSGPETSSNRKN
jgi:hypothetical protein